MLHTRTGIVLLLLLLLCAGDALSQEGLKAGIKAPDFSLPSVDGKRTVTLRQFKEKSVVILHFWKSR